MDNSRTVCQRYIIVASYIKCFLMLVRYTVSRTLVKRLIFLILQLLARISLKYFIGSLPVFCQRGKNRVKKRLGHVISIAVNTFYFCVCLFRIHAKTQVRRQRPRRSRPSQKIRIFPCCLKPDNCRTFLHILIPLRHFLSRKRGSAAGAVRNNFKAFIEKPFIPYLFERPPLRLNIIIMIRYIWVVHIRPETDGS